MREGNPFPPEVRRLKAYEMRTIISEIRKVLWFEADGKPAPDQKAPPETPLIVAAVMAQFNLKPEAAGRPKPGRTTDGGS